MEKDCKWHFGNEGGIDIGPNDPIHQTFKGSPYYSIVREAIQNSLDAIQDKEQPVNVSFQYFDLNRIEYPEFFQLESHINQSLKYYLNNSDAKQLFGGMLKYLNGPEAGKKKLKISCLKISDSNTKGMKFIEDDTQSPFYAFLRAAGVSAKTLGGSGGSFGFGKGAYFALSPIKTLIVSSKDNKGNVYFEGATRLTTHLDTENKKLTAYGFYDNNNGRPVVKEEYIPQIFRRVQTGTDINIVGLWDEPERDKLMIKSVLNNFWLAIHEKELIVKINHIIINKENLEQIIEDYFPSEYESGSASQIESWNPKPYYKSVKYNGISNQFKFFSGELTTLGSVKFFVYLAKGLPNRTSYFRRPKMVVLKKTDKRINGYAAVFVCNNDKGNEILRKMENPAHNEWSKGNYQEDGQIHIDAKKAELELTRFINEKLDSLSKINTSKKVHFMGLEDYLSIPEDLLEQEEDTNLEGENLNSHKGLISNKLTDEETGMQTTKISSDIFIKPTIKSKAFIKEVESVLVGENGDIDITEGFINGAGDQPPLTPRPHGPEGEMHLGSISDDAQITKVLRKVKLRVVAEKDGNFYNHTLIILCNEEIKNAELELFVGGDNDKDDEILIISTDVGIAKNNRIKNVILSAGKNLIKVRFADNLKHSIKIKTYEIQ